MTKRLANTSSQDMTRQPGFYWFLCAKTTLCPEKSNPLNSVR